jgi:iron(III) transport system substrate-binding protein
VIDGEIDAGLVNHYYLFGFRADDPTVSAELHFFPGGDAGSLINVAGVGVVDTSDHPGLAQRLILYLLGKDAQTYFATETFEYPLVAGVPLAEGLQPLDEIEAPDIDLSDLDDLQGTLDLLSDTGALP